IRSSTVVGTPTITATVTSAEPELSGSAPLRQDPVPSPPAPTAAPTAAKKEAIPSVTIGKHLPHRTRKHRGVVSFSADVPGSIFFCKLDGASYHRCQSPAHLSR